MRAPLRVACTLLLLAASCSSSSGSGSGGDGGAASTSSTGSGGASSCKDGATNGGETDVDCGGPTCVPCAPGKACALDRDCVMGSCVLGKCSSPCDDGAKDGDETDVDCGGPACGKCDDGKQCAVPSDCKSGQCAGGKCASNLSWARQIKGADEQQATGVAVNAMGEVIVAGSTLGTVDLGSGPHPIGVQVAPFVLALAEDGTTIFEKVYDGTGQGAITGAIAADATGGVYLAGTLAGSLPIDASTTLTSASPMGGDAFVAHVLGPTQAAWAKSWGSTMEPDLVTSAAADPTGGVVIAGSFDGTLDFGCGPLVASAHDVFVAKLDAQGACVWSLNPGSASATAVAVDTGGNTLVAGGSSSALDFGGQSLAQPASEQVFVAKLDPTGNVVYLKGFLPQYGGRATAVAVDGAGNAVFAGTCSGIANFGIGPMGTSQPGMFVAKLDPSGATLSSWVWEAKTKDDVRVAADAAGNFALAGGFSGTLDLGGGPLASMDGAFVAAFDASGAHRWSRSYACAVTGLALGPNARLAISGWFQDQVDLGGGPLTSAGKSDGFVAQLVLP